MLIDRTLATLESQFAFLRRLDFHAEMGKRAAEFGDTFVQKKAAHAAARRRRVGCRRCCLRRSSRSSSCATGSSSRSSSRAACRTRSSSARSTCSTAWTRPPQLLPGPAQADRDRHRVLGVGLWSIGVPNALVIGLVAARARVDSDGRLVIGCMLAVLVAATALPNDPWDRLRCRRRIRVRCGCSTISSSFR